MLDYYISKQIVLAQIASDGAKQIYNNEQTVKIGLLYATKGYVAKDSCILKAIHKIQKSKNSGFRFYVKFDYYSKNMKKDCYIVYFNFKIDGIKYQISFHSFSRKLKNYCNNKFETRWHKKVSSNNAYIKLGEYVGLFENKKKKEKINQITKTNIPHLQRIIELYGNFPYNKCINGIRDYYTNIYKIHKDVVFHSIAQNEADRESREKYNEVKRLLVSLNPKIYEFWKRDIEKRGFRYWFNLQ